MTFRLHWDIAFFILTVYALCWMTSWLIPWQGLLETLSSSASQEIPWKFISVFPKEPATCLYRQPEQSSPCLSLPHGLFPSGIPTKPCMHTSGPHMCHVHCPSNYWFDHLDHIWWGMQIMKIIIVQFLKFITLPVIWLILFPGHKLI
jgi:hypothetical protein